MNRRQINHIFDNLIVIVALIFVALLFIFLPEKIQNYFLIRVILPENYTGIVCITAFLLWITHVLYPWLYFWAIILVILAVLLMIPIVFNITDSLTYIIFVTIILTLLTSLIILVCYFNKDEE